MDRVMKDQWISDLRSGKYKQGRGLYRTSDNKYCSLGVLLQQNNTIENDLHFLIGIGFFKGREHKTIWSRLVKMNDDDKLTFSQIANWIEENL